MSEHPISLVRALYTKLVIQRDEHHWVWNVYLGVNSERSDAKVASVWRYHTPESAKAAAMRWCRRLAIRPDQVKVLP